MKFYTLIFALIFTASNAAAADFRLDTTGDAPLYQSALPKDIYQHSRADNLQDLTISNAAGEQVPYTLMRYEDLHPQTAIKKEVKLLNVLPIYVDDLDDSDGRQHALKYFQVAKGSVDISLEINTQIKEPNNIYLVDAGEKHPPVQSFTVDWIGHEDRFLTIDVEESDDLEHWSNIGRGVLLKTKNKNSAVGVSAIDGILVQNTITLDRASSAHYFKVMPSDRTLNGLLLTKIVAQYDSVRPLTPDILWQNIPLLKREVPSNDKALTNIDFESLGRYPASYLRVQLPQNNTITSAIVLVRNRNDAPWQTLTSASLYRMDKAGKAYTNPDIALNTSTWRYWRLQFHASNGGFGAENPTLSLGWIPKTVVWNARGQAPFILRVGNSPTIVSAVDITSLIPDYKVEKVSKLPNANIVLGTIGTSDLTSTSKPPANNSWTSAPDYKTWLLWGGLFLGVLLLAGMAYSLLKTENKA